MRRRRTALLASLSLVVLSLLGMRQIREQTATAALEQARQAEHRQADPKTILNLVQKAIDSDVADEARLIQGRAYLRSGMPEAAKASFAMVSPRSPFALEAAMEQARDELGKNRIGAAEPYLLMAKKASGRTGVEAVESLLTIYKIEGRYDEARLILQEAAKRYPDKLGVVKELATIDSVIPYPIDRAKASLSRSYQADPQDDRVWLGLANLETLQGNFAYAKAWINQALKKRPDDPAVWKSSLRLARAQENVSEVKRSLEELHHTQLQLNELFEIQAWLTVKANDSEGERAALRAWIEAAPGAAYPLERLSELEKRAGREGEAADLRDRKADLDRTRKEYGVRLFKPDAANEAAELAQMAERIGRNLDAKLLWSLAIENSPKNKLARENMARLETLLSPTNVPDVASLITMAKRINISKESTPKQELVGPTFLDDAERVGLVFTFDNGASPQKQIPETMSGGVGIIDYDNDGWLDVYLVQGGKFPPVTGEKRSGDRLFHNRGDGTFEDATIKAGIDSLPQGYGHGVTVGDFNNDGHPDLFLTRWRSYALYRNNGDGTFEDVTEKSGFAGDRGWPTSAAFADFDGDGDLDLYVCHYLKWDEHHPATCFNKEKGRYEHCGPHEFPHEQDRLFRNDGDKFVDVTDLAGITDPDGEGLGVIASDLNDDGLIDIYVANDQTANYLFINQGNMKFEERGRQNGCASNGEGAFQASMGVAVGDMNGDGLLDLAVTNFYNESTTLYENLGGAIFTDRTAASGLAAPSRYLLGFGIAMADFNNDGRLDLITANGHVDDKRPEGPWLMPAQLLLGVNGGKLVDVSAKSGAPFLVPRLARGLAVGDLDNDGRLDVLIQSQNQPLAYFHNRSDSANHYSVTLKLRGTSSNRDAVGASVLLITSAGRKMRADRVGGGSYQSAHDGRLTFGLTKEEVVGSIEIRWPSGQKSTYSMPKLHQGVPIIEEPVRLK